LCGGVYKNTGTGDIIHGGWVILSNAGAGSCGLEAVYIHSRIFSVEGRENMFKANAVFSTGLFYILNRRHI